MSYSRSLARRFGATLGGEKIPIEARFRLPEKVRAGGYRCVCELRTDRGTQEFAIGGEDAIQALLLAFMFMGIELQSLARARGVKIPRHELADWLRLRAPKRQQSRTRSKSQRRPTKPSR